MIQKKLTKLIGLKKTDFDLFVQSGQIKLQRANLIPTLKTGDDWIVEGVFGELALQFAENAQHLIWLDMDWGNCKNNLLARGSESGQQLAPRKADQHFRELLEWAANYWTREDLRSHSGHKSIFADFDHWKIKLASKNEVDDFIQASEQYF